MQSSPAKFFSNAYTLNHLLMRDIFSFNTNKQKQFYNCEKTSNCKKNSF